MTNPSNPALIETLVQQVSVLTDLLVESNERLVTLEDRVAAVEHVELPTTPEDYDDPEGLDEIGQFFGVQEFTNVLDTEDPVE